MSNRLYIAEKPDVGRKIAALLGNPRDKQTHIETDHGVVTWGFGHLITQAEPEQYDPKWRNKGLAFLPVDPRVIKLVPEEKKKDQVAAVGRLLASLGSNGEVVISTDCGPEGELIGRRILEYHRYRGKVLRFWSSAATAEGMRDALNNLQPGEKYEGLGEATKGRSDGDWLLGMNLSRAMSAMMKASCSMGRVITPTLALVVRRDAEIANFKPRDYFEVIAAVRTDEGSHQVALSYAPTKEEDRLWIKADAQAIAEAAQGQRGTLKVEQKTTRQSPPSPPALDDIQKAANTRYGWPAKMTLDLLQALYETHKCISYPRTESTAMTEDQWKDVNTILNHLRRPGILPGWPEGDWQPMKRKSAYNDAEVGDHPALGPLPNPAPWDRLSEDEKKCYSLVAQFFVAFHLPDYEALKTTISMPLAGKTFSTAGSVPKVEGWKVMFPSAGSKKGAADAENTLPPVRDGMAAAVSSASVASKQTRPPDSYNEATLLADMADAAKFEKDPELRRRLGSEEVGGLKGDGITVKKAKGLGTPATRAATIEKLKRWEYVTVSGRKLTSTTGGRHLVRSVEKWMPEYANPGLTALWEIEQENIRAGKQTYRAFLDQIIDACTATVEKLREHAPADVLAVGGAVQDGTLCPASGEPVIDMGEYWKFPGYPDVRASKTILGRPMQLSEFVQAFKNAPEPGDVLEGYMGKPKPGEKEGKPFKAALKYAPDPETKKAFVFVFPDRPAGSTTGNFITVDGVRCFPEIAHRKMSEDEYRQILKSGKEGVEFDFFSHTKQKAYKAKVVYNPKAKPYPKFELVFSNDRAGGGQSNGQGQAKAAAGARKPAGRGR